MTWWQIHWDTSLKGRCIYCFIDDIGLWVSRVQGDVNNYVTQLLIGHGHFRSYLF